ncbi:MAG: nucleotide sugar dehydrogenase [Acidimicrobiia bacterium]|nr:nucleotide sugar dehydrogenase [Acidimicrobiia bacterium]
MKLAIVGLGYVGLPLAHEACMSQMEVVGVDTSPELIEGLKAGQSHVDDLSDSDVGAMLNAGFEATVDSVAVSDADVIVICVPTPLSSDGMPDLSSVMGATRAVGKHLSGNALVVLESTTYPGTTEDVVKPVLEDASGLMAGVDFALAYSPERTDPGNPEYGLRNTPKVVGGLTDECTRRAVGFYSQLVDTVVPTVGTREAELAKLLENTYRHINIALMNEMAVFCHELGIDLWAAIEAAKTKPFGYEAFYPGPGVGGHCIPIDPNYLSWVVRSVGYRFRFVELAEEISDRMPAYVAQRVQDSLNSDKKSVNGSVVLLLGVTYKANVSDQRETPARPLAAHLVAMGADVRFFDPHADTFTVNGRELSGQASLEMALSDADLAVLVQAHDEIVGSGVLCRADRILDTRGVLSGDNVERL